MTSCKLYKLSFEMIRYRHCTGDLEVCCFLAGLTSRTDHSIISTNSVTESTKVKESTFETKRPWTTRRTLPTAKEIPTTSRTSKTTSTAREMCVCVSVLQCAFYGSIGGGVVLDPRQVVNTCIGSYVCCSNVPSK